MQSTVDSKMTTPRKRELREEGALFPSKKFKSAERALKAVDYNKINKVLGTGAISKPKRVPTTLGVRRVLGELDTHKYPGFVQTGTSKKRRLKQSLRSTARRVPAYVTPPRTSTIALAIFEDPEDCKPTRNDALTFSSDENKENELKLIAA